MKKNFYQLALMVCCMTLFSCGEDDPGTLDGDLQLAVISAELDGTELMNLSIEGFQPSFDGSAFTYSTEQGQNSGTWQVNDDETLLSVTYDAGSFEFPIVTSTKSELTFIAKAIDLSSTSLTTEEQRVLLLVNQQLIASGSSWAQVSASGQNLNIIFTLNNQ